MTPVESKPKSRVLLMVVGGLAVVAILGGAVYALVISGQSPAPKKTATTDQPAKVKPTVTNAQMEATYKDFSTTLEQEKADRAKAQLAVDNLNKLVKK